MWAKYAIYEGIDKIPQICSIWAPMWSKVDYGGGLWRACPITCISIYIYISSNSFTISSIFYLSYALEYALKGFKRPYKPCLNGGGI
jgi:hypothetical protein